MLIGVPLRILVGSERGELSSTQDQGTWNGRLQGRQEDYITPRIVVPFVNRLIELGVLPVPLEGFKVEWPDLFSISDAEKADIAKVQTETLAIYLQSNMETLIPPLEFLTKVLDKSVEDAEAILEAAVDFEEEHEHDEEEAIEEVARALPVDMEPVDTSQEVGSVDSP